MDSKEAFFAILKRIKEAWNSIGKGECTEMEANDFLKEMKKW